MGHQMLPIAFFPTDPFSHANEFWEKINYNSATVVIRLTTVKLQNISLYTS